MELLNIASNPWLPSLILLFSLLIWLKLSKRKRLNLPPSPPKAATHRQHPSSRQSPPQLSPRPLEELRPSLAPTVGLNSGCILSHKSEEEDGCSKFGQLSKRLLSLTTAFCVGDLFPYLGWLDVLTGYIPSMKALSAEFDAFLDQVIQEHRGLGGNRQVSNKKDFVSIIMQLQKNRMYDMDQGFK
ncbi:cytochrome P450 71A22-like [Hibiscus syriacus]|uniref:cytochrome P450 71A22-like n=1 Tax=Hibiscus syriacus TaxID=106335 RepID=UPI0019247A05|nr:cytochrome P450 71A22-like [Hibiscus syriacus]